MIYLFGITRIIKDLLFFNLSNFRIIFQITVILSNSVYAGRYVNGAAPGKRAAPGRPDRSVPTLRDDAPGNSVSRQISKRSAWYLNLLDKNSLEDLDIDAAPCISRIRREIYKRTLGSENRNGYNGLELKTNNYAYDAAPRPP